MKITVICTCGANLDLEGPSEACVKVSQLFLKEHERCGKEGSAPVRLCDEVWPAEWYLSGGIGG